MLLHDAIVGFLLARTADGLAHGTLTTYRWALAKFIDTTGNVENETLSKEHAQNFMAAMRDVITARGAPLANKSVENIWIALMAFDSWRAKELSLPRFFVVERPPGDYDQPTPFKDVEVKRLLKAAQSITTATTDKMRAYTRKRGTGTRDLAILLLMLDTGLRAGEVTRLTVGDLDFHDGAVQVKAWGSGKKTKSRTVYLGARSRKACWKLCQGKAADAWLFTSDGAQMTQNGIFKLFRALGERVDVPDCHPHKMRHTFAIQYLRNGGDVFTLQKLLGHSDLAMSRRYALLANTDVQDAHAKASPVDRWGL